LEELFISIVTLNQPLLGIEKETSFIEALEKKGINN